MIRRLREWMDEDKMFLVWLIVYGTVMVGVGTLVG